MLDGSGPTIFPAVYSPGSLPDILQLCAEGLDLFPVCACQVPETKILSRNQPSQARNVPVSNSEMILLKPARQDPTWQLIHFKRTALMLIPFFFFFYILLFVFLFHLLSTLLIRDVILTVVALFELWQ